jgi:hypothetical protein
MRQEGLRPTWRSCRYARDRVLGTTRPAAREISLTVRQQRTPSAYVAWGSFFVKRKERRWHFRVALRLGGRSCVPKSEQYRRLAQACLEIARNAEDERARASLRHMAQVWFRLAEERVNEVDEKQLAES